jgi:hypothetical protein
MMISKLNDQMKVSASRKVYPLEMHFQINQQFDYCWNKKLISARGYKPTIHTTTRTVAILVQA